MLNALCTSCLLFVSWTSAIPFPLPQLSATPESSGGTGKCNEFEAKEWVQDVIACELEASSIVDEVIAARDNKSNILKAVCKKITQDVKKVHSDPVITNHLGKAKNSLLAGIAFYPGSFSNEMELFSGLKFVLSGNSL